MKKLHILLVENGENEIEFFTDALKESGLYFLCNTARSIEEAFIILKGSMFDAVFMNAGIIKSERSAVIKRIKQMQKMPVIIYSTVAG